MPFVPLPDDGNCRDNHGVHEASTDQMVLCSLFYDHKQRRHLGDDHCKVYQRHIQDCMECAPQNLRGNGKQKQNLGGDRTPTVSEENPEYLRMQVMPDAKDDTLLDFARENVQEGSTVHSDAFRSGNALPAEYESIMKKYIPDKKDKHLKWLHVMIFNIKANIDGVYHGIEGPYLQRYLDEFCYRFNRRHTEQPLFERLLACSVKIVTKVCI